jgi:hypothetical protein
MVPVDTKRSLARSRTHDGFAYIEAQYVNLFRFLRKPILGDGNCKEEVIFSSDWIAGGDAGQGGFIQSIMESPRHDHFAFIQLLPWQEQGSLKIWKTGRNERSSEVMNAVKLFFQWNNGSD